MIATTEDDLITYVRTIGDRANQLRGAQIIASEAYGSLVPKAQWAYRHALRRLAQPVLRSAQFERGYLASWTTFLVAAARASAGDMPRIARDHLTRSMVLASARHERRPSPLLVVSWHHPRWPFLLQVARRMRGCCLIAQSATWMENAAGSELLYRFGTPSDAFGVARAFRERLPVWAMLDYCYERTAAVEADFLGYPSRTPCGVLKLAQRFGYSVAIVSWRGATCTVIEQFSMAGENIDQAANRVNRAISAEILHAPACWLLWPSVDRRWIGVDYSW